MKGGVGASSITHTRRKRSPPLPCEVSKCRTPGLAVLTWGGGVLKESVNPCPGTKCPDFEVYYTYLPNVSPISGECAPPLPLGCLHVQAGSFAWRPRPHLASPTPGDARTWRRPCLATPTPGDAFPLAFPYITRKKSRGR